MLSDLRVQRRLIDYVVHNIVFANETQAEGLKPILEDQESRVGLIEEG